MKRDTNLFHRPPVFLLFSFTILIGGVQSLGFAQTLQPIQRIEIPSSPNPVGSGARALGMGSAFIAVADDATAASWNPGGLVQLETTEVSVVGAYFNREEDITLSENPEASGSQNVSNTYPNYLSGVYPFTLGEHNMVVALNYQYLFDFSRDWKFLLPTSGGGSAADPIVNYTQEGQLQAYGLAYSVELSPNLSFGMTLNIWEDGFYRNGWKQKITLESTGTSNGNVFNFTSNGVDRFSFNGINANLGILWNVTSHLTIGAVAKTPFEANLKRKSSFSSSIRFPDNPAATEDNSSSEVRNNRLDMPMSYGIGIAYRFSDAFTAAFDVYRTEWDDFVLKVSDGEDISFITGKPKSESDIDPTHQIRAGAEYLLIKSNYTIPLRAGLFYDPAPAEGSPDDFYGFSVGSGLAIGQIIFDIAYQFRYGDDVSKFILEDKDFSQDVKEHTVYSSLILHF